MIKILLAFLVQVSKRGEGATPTRSPPNETPFVGHVLCPTYKVYRGEGAAPTRYPFKKSHSWVDFSTPEPLINLKFQDTAMRFFNTAGPVDCEGRTEREYGLGRMRTDLLVIWPYPGGVQKVVIELKVLHKTLEQTLATGLEQTWSYLDRCGAEKGHLVIFDRTPGKPWEEKLFQRTASIHDRTIQVWGM